MEGEHVKYRKDVLRSLNKGSDVAPGTYSSCRQLFCRQKHARLPLTALMKPCEEDAATCQVFFILLFGETSYWFLLKHSICLRCATLFFCDFLRGTLEVYSYALNVLKLTPLLVVSSFFIRQRKRREHHWFCNKENIKVPTDHKNEQKR